MALDRTERVRENVEATHVALSADEIADLDALAARAHGDRCNEHHMGLVGK